MIRLEQGARCHPKYCVKHPEVNSSNVFFFIAAGGFDRDGGPASVGDARTGSGESDAIEGCGAGGAAFARVEEPEPSRTESNLINHDLLLQPPALASYPACSEEPKPFSRTASKP